MPTRTYPAPLQMLQEVTKTLTIGNWYRQVLRDNQGHSHAHFHAEDHYSQFETPAMETSSPLALTHSFASHAGAKRNDFPVVSPPLSFSFKRCRANLKSDRRTMQTSEGSRTTKRNGHSLPPRTAKVAQRCASGSLEQKGDPRQPHGHTSNITLGQCN